MIGQTRKVACAGVIMATLLMACSPGGSVGGSPGRSVGESVSRSPGESVSRSPGESVSRSPSAAASAPSEKAVAIPTPAGLPQAADGTDLAACRDGSCEVEVERGDRLRFAPKFRIDLMTVSALQTNRITLVPKTKGRINDLQVRLLGTADGRAVVLFAPR